MITLNDQMTDRFWMRRCYALQTVMYLVVTGLANVTPHGWRRGNKAVQGMREKFNKTYQRKKLHKFI